MTIAGEPNLLFANTIRRTSISLGTIAAMLALGYTARFSGLDATMGLAFASTGFLFPFFSPLLGWLGVALTGSDTASNVLFGSLQQITTERLGSPHYTRRSRVVMTKVNEPANQEIHDRPDSFICHGNPILTDVDTVAMAS